MEAPLPPKQTKLILDYASSRQNSKYRKLIRFGILGLIVISIVLWIASYWSTIAFPVAPYGDEVIALGAQNGWIYFGEYASWEKTFYQAIAIPCWGFTACAAVAYILAARQVIFKNKP